MEVTNNLLVNKNLYFDDYIEYNELTYLPKSDKKEYNIHKQLVEIEIVKYNHKITSYLYHILYFEKSKYYKHIYQILCDKIPIIKSNKFIHYITKRLRNDLNNNEITLNNSTCINDNKIMKYISYLFNINIVVFTNKNITIHYPNKTISLDNSFIYIYKDKNGYRYLHNNDKKDINNVLFKNQYSIIKYIVNEEIKLY